MSCATRSPPAGAQSASTLYTLTGPRAQSSLLAQVSADLIAAGPRCDAVARLAVEVKVWSHWPYRAGWLTELGNAEPHSRQFAAATLIRVLALWAHSSQRLAASYACDPPLSVVEDLVVIAAGNASGPQARELLAQVIELARGPVGAAPDEVLEAVSADLAAIGLVGRPVFGEVTDRLAESLAALRHLWPRLALEQRSQLHEEFGPEFANLAELVGGGHER